MPSNMTDYLVFEEVDGAYQPMRSVEARDHRQAIDFALAEREPEQRVGTFAACPRRNWRSYALATQLRYDTTATELGTPVASGDLTAAAGS